MDTDINDMFFIVSVCFYSLSVCFMKLSQLIDMNQDIMRCFDMSQIRVNSYLRNYFVLILNRGVFDLCGDIREDKGDDECDDGKMKMNENRKKKE